MLSLRFTSKHLLITIDGVTESYVIPDHMQRRVHRLVYKSYSQDAPPTASRKNVSKSPSQTVKFSEHVR
jgi:hypothetical protein